MTEKRYVPYQNGLGLWIIEDKFKNDVVRIPSFLGFDNEETAKSICDEWNTLYDENEQLKEHLEICKDARQAYKQDWKDCVSYCDTYKDELHTLKDNIQGLIEENEQLKQQIKDLRIGVLDSIRESDEIQCNCNPCVVEECVKRVVE